eukprot:2224816-Prymnesium_polylepis.1
MADDDARSGLPACMPDPDDLHVMGRVLAGICTANGYMAVANTLVSLSWLTLSVVAATSLQVCDDFWQIQKLVVATTALSCLEVVHAAVGLTRSKPGNVILFVGARAFIALYICPLAGCSATYRTTAFTWGLGECIRLGCFAVDAVRPSVTAKTVRASPAAPKEARRGETLPSLTETCGVHTRRCATPWDRSCSRSARWASGSC